MPQTTKPAPKSITPSNMTPLASLNSKVNSILRTLENLSQKKIRIEAEYKRQTIALKRKREALKREHSSKLKLKESLDNTHFYSELLNDNETREELKESQQLLRESAEFCR